MPKAHILVLDVLFRFLITTALILGVSAFILHFVNNSDSFVNNSDSFKLWGTKTKRDSSNNTHIIGGMATIPNRQQILTDTIESLDGQLDHLYVHANYPMDTPTPTCLDRPWITVTRSHDMGDVGKYVGLWTTLNEREKHNEDFYYFTLDDDIKYPVDYVYQTIKGLERYDNKVIVSYHGGVLPEYVTNFFKQREKHHFTEMLDRDDPVNIVGTGVTAFYSSVLPINREDFETTRASDIHFSRRAQHHRVPMVTLAHPKEWLQDHGPYQPTSLWSDEKNSNSFKHINNELTQRTRWTIYIYCKESYKHIKNNPSQIFDKYLTVQLLKPDGTMGGSGGLRHCEVLLANLLVIAHNSNRQLILPPPCDLIDKMHGKIHEFTTWKDYYNTNIITKRLDDICGKTNKVVYNVEQANFKDIKQDDTPLIILKLQDDESYNNAPFDKLNPYKIDDLNDVLPYTNESIKYAAGLIKQNLKNFATIHVRRGDVITSDTCYGPSSAFKYATSIKRIKEKADKYKNLDYIIIFSNEKKEYFKELLESSQPKYLFESDLSKMIDFEILDNCHAVLFNSEIAKLGKKHICTLEKKMDVKCDDLLCYGTGGGKCSAP